jgi:UDP-N-acetylmuramoylalanine--D-glutamate ligase
MNGVRGKMDFHGKKIVVIGMGKTGIATAKFLGSQGAEVIAADEKLSTQWGPDYERIATEKWLSVGNYTADDLAGTSMVVPSPGVPPYNEILVAAQNRQIPIVGEIELAYRFLKVPVIAVTGTNGKTTTTSLLGDILARAGKKVFVGGNIGNPLIEYVMTAQEDDFVVAEISSFQLQWIDKFRPHVAMLLNVTCDHINYHGSFDEYRRIKARVFVNQTKADFAILNTDDPAQKTMADSLLADVVWFSSTKKLQRGIYLQGNALIFNKNDGTEEQYPVSMIKIPGLHNIENVMAAIMAARFCGCTRESIIAAVSDFHGLPHRIEFAGEKKTIKFYDDSKGTNVGSVVRALDTFSAPVILLLGGRDKDGDFDTLQPLLKQKSFCRTSRQLPITTTPLQGKTFHINTGQVNSGTKGTGTRRPDAPGRNSCGNRRTCPASASRRECRLPPRGSGIHSGIPRVLIFCGRFCIRPFASLHPPFGLRTSRFQVRTSDPRSAVYWGAAK